MIENPTLKSQEAMEAKTIGIPPRERTEEGGSTVVVTPILESGTKIAEIEVDGETSNLYAPEGGSDVSVTQVLESGTKIAEIEVDGNTTNLFAPTPEAELPTGGTAGQVLEKYGSGDAEIYWANKMAVPTGGTSGQVLTKVGSQNNDYDWRTPTAPTPAGYSTYFNVSSGSGSRVSEISISDFSTTTESVTAELANKCHFSALKTETLQQEINLAGVTELSLKPILNLGNISVSTTITKPCLIRPILRIALEFIDANQQTIGYLTRGFKYSDPYGYEREYIQLDSSATPHQFSLNFYVGYLLPDWYATAPNSISGIAGVGTTVDLLFDIVSVSDSDAANNIAITLDQNLSIINEVNQFNPVKIIEAAT